MKCILDNKITIEKEGVPEKVLFQIRQDLTYDNPEYKSRVRYDYYTGNTHRHIEEFVEDSNSITIPRGYLHRLQNPEIIDKTLSFDTELDTNLHLKLRDYQLTASTLFIRKKQGVVVIPCGGGKTVVALKIIHRLQQPTLIIVHTHDLLEQWGENLETHLSVKQVSKLNGSTKEIGQITVATIQSLNTYDLEKIKDRFGLVILDEAHHVPANTFRKVINHFPAQYRLGLSATPFREDGLNDLLFHTMGDIVYETSYPRLIDVGYLIKPTYTEIPTEFDIAPKKTTKTGRIILDWHKMTNYLIQNDKRNQIILNTILRTHKKGELGLVLSGRIEHLEFLCKEMKTHNLVCEILIGNTPKEKRKEILDDAKAGNVDLLFSANISDEGLDLPNLNTVYLTFPNKSEAKVIQRIGRILRPFPGKTNAQIFDFIDKKVGVLYRQAKKRQKIINKTFWSEQ